MRAVVLTFDRLPLHELGCYGNQRAVTPSFDKLAAQSITFDFHFAEHLSSASACQAWWTGAYTFPRHGVDHSPIEGATLPAVLKSHGVDARLIRETDFEVSGIPYEDFSVTVSAGTEQPARADASPFALLVDEARRHLQELANQPSWLLWVHSSGVPALQESAGAAATSRTTVDSMRDLDHQLGRLQSVLGETLPGEHVLFVVTAARGDLPAYPPALSRQANRLAEPLVHTPLMARSRSDQMGSRQRSFVQTVDLAVTLLEWFQIPLEALACEGRSWLPALVGPLEAERSYVCYGDDKGSAAIRTEDFCVIVDDLEAALTEDTAGLPESGVQLFLKPDDFWEVDEAAAQFPDQAAALLTTLREFVEGARRQSPMQVPQLALPGDNAPED